MRLKLIIDGIYHEIDSTDPELLGKWIVEILGRVRNPTPATMFQMQAQPSWIPDDGPHGGHLDWVADTRIIGQMVTITSARDLVAALSDQIDQWEAISRDQPA